MRRSLAALAALAGLAALVAPLPAVAADRDAAERQYRVARRLAAEGSAEAVSALREVVRLDPDGPLADDATVDEALLAGLPSWPEELGRMGRDAAATAASILSRVADGMPGADRAPEAAYRRALLRLEPLPGRDPGGARVDLLAVASNPDAGAWGAAARYTLGVLAEAAGERGRARDAWYRVIVDAPGDPAWARAAAGLGRLALRAGRPDDAARRFEEARRAGAPGDAATLGVELAVRRVLDARPAAGTVPVVTPLGDVRVTAVAVAPNGELAIADRRGAAVQRLAPAGGSRGRWSLDDVTALGFDPEGRLFAAAGDRVYRLTEGSPPLDVGGQGQLAPVSALAPAPLGVVWLLDRRGEVLGRLDPGAAAAVPAWSERGVRLAGLAWDGRRLVTSLPKADTAATIDPATGVTAVGPTLTRSGAVAVDPSGRIGAVDVRAGVLLLLDDEGRELARLDLASLGVERPEWAGLDASGRLHLWDGEQTWMMVP